MIDGRISYIFQVSHAQGLRLPMDGFGYSAT